MGRRQSDRRRATQSRSRPRGPAARPPAPATPILDAFFPCGRRVGEIVFQPFTMMHYLAFERVQSPFIAEGTAPRRLATFDILRGLLLVSLTGLQVREAFAGGVEGFDAAVHAFAARIPVADIKGVVRRIYEHIEGAFVTTISGGEGAAGAAPFAPPAAAGETASSGSPASPT